MRTSIRVQRILDKQKARHDKTFGSRALSLSGWGLQSAFYYGAFIKSAKLRNALFKDYAKNAFEISGRKFNERAYRRWLRPYLERTNRLRASGNYGHRAQALLRDLKHFNPKYIIRESESLIRNPTFRNVYKQERIGAKMKRTAYQKKLFPTPLKTPATYAERMALLKQRNIRSAKKVFPRRGGVIAGLILGGLASRAVIAKIKKERWKRELKRSAEDAIDPFARAAAYGIRDRSRLL